MSRRLFRLGPLVLIAALGALGCSSDPGKEPPLAPAAAGTAAKAPAAAEAAAPKVPILEGYVYYVGGPSLKIDAYGRLRVKGFNDPVSDPPSHGLIFGAKRDGDRLEYRVWANGRIVGLHRGVMKDGLFWKEYAEGFRDQKTSSRETTINDDAAQVMRIKNEDIDPATGEVIRVTEFTQKYQAPVIADPELDDEGDDAGEAKFETPPPAAAPTPPAVPTPAAPPSGTGK